MPWPRMLSSVNAPITLLVFSSRMMWHASGLAGPSFIRPTASSPRKASQCGREESTSSCSKRVL